MARAVGELQKIVLTYDDYLCLPNDGKRYEVLEGELFVSPAPRTKHQIASGNLYAVLHQHVRKHKRGRVFSAPTDVILSQTNVVQPDLLFISNERKKIITEKNIHGAPDLIVEILSETSAEQDRTAKKQIYAATASKSIGWLIPTPKPSKFTSLTPRHGRSSTSRRTKAMRLFSRRFCPV